MTLTSVCCRQQEKMGIGLWKAIWQCGSKAIKCTFILTQKLHLDAFSPKEIVQKHGKGVCTKMILEAFFS